MSLYTRLPWNCRGWAQMAHCLVTTAAAVASVFVQVWRSSCFGAALGTITPARCLLWWRLCPACKTWWVVDCTAGHVSQAHVGSTSPHSPHSLITTQQRVLQFWSYDTVCTIRQGAYLSHLTSLSLLPDAAGFPDDDLFFDLLPLKGGAFRRAAAVAVVLPQPHFCRACPLAKAASSYRLGQLGLLHKCLPTRVAR